MTIIDRDYTHEELRLKKNPVCGHYWCFGKTCDNPKNIQYFPDWKDYKSYGTTHYKRGNDVFDDSGALVHREIPKI